MVQFPYLKKCNSHKEIYYTALDQFIYIKHSL